MIGSALETSKLNLDRLHREVAALMEELRESGVQATYEVASIGPMALPSKLLIALTDDTPETRDRVIRVLGPLHVPLEFKSADGGTAAES